MNAVKNSDQVEGGSMVSLELGQGLKGQLQQNTAQNLLSWNELDNMA